MTLGIAYNLGFAVVMVADGRERNGSKEGMPITDDDLDKIGVVGDSVAVMTFGISQIAEAARESLSDRLKQCSSAVELTDSSLDCLEKSWEAVLPTLRHEDSNDPKMAAGLLIGGHFAEVPFVGRTGKSGSVEVPSKIEFDIDAYLMAGISQSDRFRACTFFRINLHEKRRDADPPLDDEQLIQAVVDSAAATIRFIEESNPYVGGRIRYAVIRPNEEIRTRLYQ